MDLQGVEHAEKRAKLWDSFLECMRHHLVTVFNNDATETERYYISNCLKKPNRVPIWQFVQRVQQLNSYLELLPCFHYSPWATKLTKKLGPFDDQDLASHILHMCPGTWQAQYELTKDTVPQSMRKLLEALECIEKAFPMDKEKGKTNQGDSNKRKMVSFLERILKNKYPETKHCVLCKKHGGTHSTHNMMDCCKYEKDGTPKKTFGCNQLHGSSSEEKHTQSYAQLSDKLAKLKKARKKLKKISSGKHKCYDSNSDESDSSWSVWSGSTGVLNVKDNKSRTLLSDYPNPIPSKTTNSLKTKVTSESTNSDSLPPLRQGNSYNMSSSNDKGQVIAVVAKVRFTATKNWAHRRIKQPGWRCSSDQIIRVMLDSGFDRDLMFHEKGTSMHFPYLTR